MLLTFKKEQMPNTIAKKMKRLPHWCTALRTLSLGKEYTLSTSPKKIAKRGYAVPLKKAPIKPNTMIHHSGPFLLMIRHRDTSGISSVTSSFFFFSSDLDIVATWPGSETLGSTKC